MFVDNAELSLLNFYRASELHGGLILGQMVRRTRDAELIMQLTKHSAEEVMHALLWTETILHVAIFEDLAESAPAAVLADDVRGDPLICARAPEEKGERRAQQAGESRHRAIVSLVP